MKMKTHYISIASLTCFILLCDTLPFCEAKAKSSLTVHITDKTDYCFILPKQQQGIGDAERPGGMQAWCTKPSSKGGQGTLPPGFFTKGPYIKKGNGHGAYKQITGCIDPSKAPTLLPSDGGGQVDSNGGSDGKGNPAHSACRGYASYVSIIEPESNTICLRCCQNTADCPVDQDTKGCHGIIKGKYC